MGLQHSYLSSLYMLWFICYFLAVWVVIFVILCSIVLLCVCWVWWIVFDVDFIWYCFAGHNALIFVLCFDICWCLYSFGKWVWCFFLVFTPFVCMKVYLCLWFWITYLVSLCFCCHFMCVLLSWVYYFNTFIFLFDLSHCHFFWLYVVLIVHFRLMIDYLIDSHL